MTDGELVIEVTNSGTWVEPAADRPGTGLANLRRRLELSGLEHRLDGRALGVVVTAFEDYAVEAFDTAAAPQVTFVGSPATLTIGRAATRRLKDRLDGNG